MEVERKNFDEKYLGLFKKITKFKNIFPIIEEFLSDGKSFFTLVSLNKYFRKLTQYDKILKVVTYIKEKKNKTLLFSPYSWLHYPSDFETKKNKFISEISKYEEIGEHQFHILFNLSKRLYEKLDFANFNLNSMGAQILFKYKKNFMDIKILILSHCNINYVTYDEYIGKIIKKCYNLKKLGLEYNLLTKECGEIICDSIINCNQLENINISYNPIGHGIISLRPFFKNNMMIRELYLSDSKVNEKEFEFLSFMFYQDFNINFISKLDLSSNDTNPIIIEKLFKSLSSNTSLFYLNLNNSQINDEAMVHINRFIKKNDYLRVLLLSKNFIKNSWEEIVNSLTRNQRLDIFDISFNNLQNNCFNVMLKNIEKINLSLILIDCSDIRINYELYLEKLKIFNENNLLTIQVRSVTINKENYKDKRLEFERNQIIIE